MDADQKSTSPGKCVSIALIGVGGIGAYHLASLRKLEDEGRARLVAVAEPAMERFPELRRELAARGVRWYSGCRELLDGESYLTAVTIATPIPFHFEMVLACLERGLFVNLEKPPVPVVQQLESLIDADEAGRVTVGFQMIMSSCVQRMKELIVQGEIGELRSIRACGCWPRLNSYYQRAPWAGRLTFNGLPTFDGPASNALAHVIHNIMFLADPARDGFAVPVEAEGELYRSRPIESYDVACLRGKFESGVDFAFAATHSTRDALPFKIEAAGTGGWLRLSDDGHCLETSAGEALHCKNTTQELLDTCYVRFLQVVLDRGVRTYTSLEDTRGYVRATNGMLLSSGGIHDIGPEWVEQYSRKDDAGFEVRGLRAAVERVFAEGRLFSELALDWAQARPVPIRLDNFQTLDLNTNLAMTSA